MAMLGGDTLGALPAGGPVGVCSGQMADMRQAGFVVAELLDRQCCHVQDVMRAGACSMQGAMQGEAGGVPGTGVPGHPLARRGRVRACQSKDDC